MGRRKQKPKEPIADENSWTPAAAIQWLIFKARRVKYGTNCYAETLGVIRGLLRDRRQLNETIEKQTQEIQKLQKLKTRQPFGTEANGTWSD